MMTEEIRSRGAPRGRRAGSLGPRTPHERSMTAPLRPLARARNCPTEGSGSGIHGRVWTCNHGRSLPTSRMPASCLVPRDASTLTGCFWGQLSLTSIDVVDGDRRTVVDRTWFAAWFSGRLGYARALHAIRPVGELVTRPTLEFTHDTRVAEAAERLVPREGRQRYIDAVVTHDDTVIDTVSVATILEELARTFECRAHHDPLTGLHNRALLVDRLEQTLAWRMRDRHDAEVVGLLFLDLDGFKAANDGLGHDADDGHIMDLAHRLVQTLRVPFELALGPVSVHASIGVTIAAHGDVASDLLKRADRAMYRAKQRGGDGCIRADVNAGSGGCTNDASRLRRAIDRDELTLHYQPVVDFDGRGYAGARHWCDGRSPTGPSGLLPASSRLRSGVERFPAAARGHAVHCPGRRRARTIRRCVGAPRMRSWSGLSPRSPAAGRGACRPVDLRFCRGVGAGSVRERVGGRVGDLGAGIREP